MTWTPPGWWAFVLLALAAFRVYRLLAADALLDRPRDWVTARVGEKAELFVVCPWCLGFWVAAGWWLAWAASPHWTVVVAAPFALSAVVALLEVNLDAN